jgi:hypothetical protein
VENKEPAFRKLASSPVRGHRCLCDDGGGVDSAWAGAERRRWAVASTGEEDVRQGVQGQGGGGDGGPARGGARGACPSSPALDAAAWAPAALLAAAPGGACPSSPALGAAAWAPAALLAAAVGVRGFGGTRFVPLTRGAHRK